MAWSSSWIEPVKNNWLDKLEQSSEAKLHEEINGGINPIAIGVIEQKEVQLEIPIKGRWDNTKVKAIQVGDLAVHEPLGWDDNYSWRVTHVPTLTMFDKAIPVVTATEKQIYGEGSDKVIDKINWTDEQLIKWCWKVQQDYQIYWNTLREFTNKNYNEINPELLDNLRKYCLHIPVE